MSRVKGGQNAPLCSSASLFSCPKYLFTFLSSFRERERKRCCEHNIGNLWKLRLERKIMNFWAFSKFLNGITPPPPTYFTEEKSYQITKEEEEGVISPENCSWLFFRSNYKNILCGKNGYFVSITRCLKITEKVSFNITSEASYVFILSGQKLIKNAKNDPIWRVFENLKLAVKQSYQTGQFE